MDRILKVSSNNDDPSYDLFFSIPYDMAYEDAAQRVAQIITALKITNPDGLDVDDLLDVTFDEGFNHLTVVPVSETF